MTGIVVGTFKTFFVSNVTKMRKRTPVYLGGEIISKSFIKSEAKRVPRTDRRLHSSWVFLVSKHPSWHTVIMFGNEEKSLEISLV